MSGTIWTPGMAGPLDELMARLSRMVGAFAQQHELEQAEVRIELADGSRHVIASSFTPHGETGGEPRRVIVPIGAVKTIEISAPDAESPFGFAVSE